MEQRAKLLLLVDLVANNSGVAANMQLCCSWEHSYCPSRSACTGVANVAVKDSSIDVSKCKSTT
jgi:hypothetical protein